VNSGNLELNYPIGSAADSLLTPDFRLQLPGPGQIHVAVRINANGDTCVQSLSSNGSALEVSEVMGDDSYQVKQDEAVLFKGGHIQGSVRTHQSCGCPAPPPVQVAHVETSPPAAPKPAPKPPPTSGAALAAAMDEAPPTIAEAHLTVDAPFVFHGADVPPDMTEIVAHLKMENDQVMWLQPVVLPPGKHQKPKPAAQQTTVVASNQTNSKRGFFGAIGAFFASIFH